MCVCVHKHVCVLEREMGMGDNIRSLHNKNLRVGRGAKSSMFGEMIPSDFVKMEKTLIETDG